MIHTFKQVVNPTLWDLCPLSKKTCRQVIAKSRKTSPKSVPDILYWVRIGRTCWSNHSKQCCMFRIMVDNARFMWWWCGTLVLSSINMESGFLATLTHANEFTLAQMC
ncbi:hypothetical protein TNCT_263701 [Trichonephila clavata]|uniref:Uncharacterized protein n=1 Tax=Trichonephila clavata TaxID=2740835 RepID=A0A8X6H4T5_TRICU|nr:hypothetical protein TNCT_263701 [Trichonephila clavata]